MLVPVENAVYRCIRVRQVREDAWVEALSCERVRVFGDLPGRAVRHSHAAKVCCRSTRRGLPLAVLGSRVQHRRQLRPEHGTGGRTAAERAQLTSPQAIGLTVQNFVTPAVGLGVLFALFRGIVSEGIQASETSGSM